MMILIQILKKTMFNIKFQNIQVIKELNKIQTLSVYHSPQCKYYNFLKFGNQIILITYINKSIIKLDLEHESQNLKLTPILNLQSNRIKQLTLKVCNILGFLIYLIIQYPYWVHYKLYQN
ncbi:unnamed protein product [Paramecium sonneborni]|uniref:Transmembrane protein n=1 Tax=Paramecium sonneborni TaxID=65129 RepID=A0A8S1PLP1_9CILI|nr:unnamed protein product [Paramecium sonneborni]